MMGKLFCTRPLGRWIKGGLAFEMLVSSILASPVRWICSEVFRLVGGLDLVG